MAYSYRADYGPEPPKRSRYYTEAETDPSYQWTATPLEFEQNADQMKTSRVIQLQGLPSTCIEAEVMAVLRKFGTIIDCYILSNKGQALVEFERIEDADNVLLLQQQRHCISISNCVPSISYSHIQSLQSLTDPSATINNAATGSSSAGLNNGLASSASIHNQYGGGSQDPATLLPANYPPHHLHPDYTAAEQEQHYPQGGKDSGYYSQSTARTSSYASAGGHNPRVRNMSSRPDEHYANGGTSNSASSTSPAEMTRRPRERTNEKPNKVLLFTIMRPDYPINVRVLLAVCKKYDCAPVRMYVFRKRGVQAMVEFDSIETATHVKRNIDGADIYSGCCTLRIEFARPETLNVTRNSEDTYNVELLEGSEVAPPQRGSRMDPGLLPAPEGQGDYHGDHYTTRGVQQLSPQAGGPGMSRRPGGGYTVVRSPPQGGGMGGRRPTQGGYRGGPAMGLSEPEVYIDSRGNFSLGGRQPAPLMRQNDPYYVPVDELEQGGYGPQAGLMERGGGGGNMDLMPVVLMMYGLHEEKFGPQRLFNLLCIFGNVNKIKFMKSKPGSAMVEMQGQEAVARVMQVVTGLEVFGSKITPKPSKQQELFERGGDDSKMQTGEPYFVNFMGIREQRFSTQLERSKNRLQTPKKTLHAFNLPKGLTEDVLLKMLEDKGCATPQKVKFVENKYKEEAKKVSANVMFESLSESTEALVLANHTLYTAPDNKKYAMKLCYSSGRDD